MSQYPFFQSFALVGKSRKSIGKAFPNDRPRDTFPPYDTVFLTAAMLSFDTRTCDLCLKTSRAVQYTTLESTPTYTEAAATERDRTDASHYAEMSDQALEGVLSFIEVHIFEIHEDMKMTAVGKEESSSVSTRTNAGWEKVIQPNDKEEISINVASGRQVCAMKVWLKFEKIGKS